MGSHLNPQLRPGKALPERFRTVQSVVVVVLTLVFIAIATHRIWQLRVAAERAAVLHTIGTLRSAVSVQLVTRLRQGGLAGIGSLERVDPMTFLAPRPTNYRRLDGPTPADQLEPGYWYFEPVEGVLIYRVRYDAYFDSPLAGPSRIRLQLQLHYVDGNGNHRYDAESEELLTVGLALLEPYRWHTP